MDIPHVKGKVARQAHVGIPEGTVEEEYARGGFFGPYAHLYRSEAPVGWTRIEGPTKPRAYQAMEGTPKDAQADFPVSRRAWLYNDDCRIETATLTGAMPFVYRNADGDELVFVHDGAGTMETDFGPLAYERGDYVIVPRGTAYRMIPTSASKLLVVESKGAYRVPDRGMLGQHALFDPSVVVVPEPREDYETDLRDQNEYELRIKRGAQITKVFYPFNPLNTVGWKGTLSAWKINVRDIRPVMSERYHLPPSAHTTVLAENLVICTFLPRGLETGDDTALKVPFYHSNIDFDEVIFYHDGDFFSRDGIDAGMLTFHPQGIHHGPQQKAIERSKDAKRTDEVAVMIDTRYPLHPTVEGEEFEVSDYWQSWQA